MEQQLLLKLLWINNEPTRMNMLRMFLQGPGADPSVNKMSPELFLQAIAYHGKLVKIIMETIPGKEELCQQEMGILLQIAMNTRVALVEMHGEDSPIVLRFQDGLSPVFT
ncbi:expressed unknown protein [Seminavis robusta]|uniref:Uncharacterized protein n=1 Tax=Seminavis robusta TaxID=568900 RepID=A0A9N8E870_9STRA|nr:expressed unknown protein [Seminavis robusta]|eukprot:Sro790_g202750.1 n/a (110) ;mRNA; f:6798-7127